MPPPLFAISHAHANREDITSRKLLEKFVMDLTVAVYQETGAANKEDIAFVDYEDLQVGTLWNTALSKALQSASVGVALYSPHYFNSEWCGREFQVFLNRRSSTAVNSGIIPVLWLPARNIPETARGLQYADGLFPEDYKSLGMLGLLQLASYQDAYVSAVKRVASLIVQASQTGLETLPPFVLSEVESAWTPGVVSSPARPMSGSVTKTCFVYLSTQDWQWRPYENGRGINAMALKIASDLDIEFEKIAFDEEIIESLQLMNGKNIPTVILGDPSSLATREVARALREYDKWTLPNCGAVFAWPSGMKGRVKECSEWQALYSFCKDKIDDSKPNHEWNTIFSNNELEVRTRAVIEAIRLRLVQKLATTGEGTGPLRAESQLLTEAAASQGVTLGTAPQIGTAQP